MHKMISKRFEDIYDQKQKNKLRSVVWFMRKIGLVEMPMGILKMKKILIQKKCIATLTRNINCC